MLELHGEELLHDLKGAVGGSPFRGVLQPLPTGKESPSPDRSRVFEVVEEYEGAHWPSSSVDRKASPF